MRSMRPVTMEKDAVAYRKGGFWTDTSIFQKFSETAAQFAWKTAIIRDGTQTTYSELLVRAQNIARGLSVAGIKKGDIVAVQTPASIEQPLLHIALNAIGAIFLPLHPAFQESEVVHLTDKAKAKAAFVMDASGTGKQVAVLREKCPSVTAVWEIGASDGLAAVEAAGRDATGDIPLGVSAPDEIGHIMLSSGTTAMPKVSVFTNNNIISMMQAFADMIHLSATDIAAAIAPTGTGATGYIFPVLPVLLAGGTVVLLPKWKDPADAVRLIVDHKCTYATAIPTQIDLMLPALEAAPEGAFESFRCFSNAGAPLAPSIARTIETLMQCRVEVVYGATDGGVPCMTSIDDPEEKRTTTVGRVLPGRVLELRDAEGKVVPSGSAGEIYWKTPDKSFGYLNDDEASSQAFTDDGFYRSGDLGQLDAEGYLRIVGRVKDMILRGGQNISPRLIEEHLITHPSVREVAVAAMPDAKLGERACAFVVLKPDVAGLTLEEVSAFLDSKNIVKWQYPERIEIMTELPRSAGDKIAKNKLTEFITKKLQSEAA